MEINRYTKYDNGDIDNETAFDKFFKWMDREY